MEKKLNELLLAGKIHEVQSHLEKLEVKKVPRQEILGIANVARRAGFHRLALRLLNPIVRPKNKLAKTRATPGELVEYAIILFRLGVVEESRRILLSPEVKPCAESELYLAFTYFGEWDYARAKKLLLSYIQDPAVAAYDKLIGLVNLAQAYVGNDEPDNAIEVLHAIIDQSKSRNYNLILANALQTYAEALIDKKEFAGVTKILKDIENVIGSSHYRYNLLVQKNLAVIDLYKNKSAEAIVKVRNACQEKRVHELLRECDVTLAVATKDENLLHKVYFGTPYPAYRERLRRHWGKDLKVPDNFIWDLNSESSTRSTHVFDVAAGVQLNSNVEIKKGTSIYRLLNAFASNLYKTFKTEALFSMLFPDEHLIINTSSHRVYDTICRARDWMKENNLNFYIDEVHGEYSLKADIKYQLKIPQEFTLKTNVHGEHIKEMLTKLGDKQFSVGEVVTALQVSVATANRYLKEAVEMKLLERLGSGRATKYVLKRDKAG
jgi:hypothetical protein